MLAVGGSVPPAALPSEPRARRWRLLSGAPCRIFSLVGILSRFFSFFFRLDVLLTLGEDSLERWRRKRVNLVEFGVAEVSLVLNLRGNGKRDDALTNAEFEFELRLVKLERGMVLVAEAQTYQAGEPRDETHPQLLVDFFNLLVGEL